MRQYFLLQQLSQEIFELLPSQTNLLLFSSMSINDLRKKRNNLLAETDWMANSDVTMSDDWKTYRQELRDLPAGLDTVEKVEAKEFPTKPSGV